jgi:carboxypeptidase family protein
MKGAAPNRADERTRRSRRRFLKAAAVGATALVAGPAIAARPAGAQLPGCEQYPNPQDCPYNPGYREDDLGQITLGAILISYASAPLSARGTLTYSMSRTRTETMRMITERGEQETLSVSLFNYNSGTQQSRERFGVSGGFERVQGRSTKVTDAIAHSSTQTETIQTAPTNGEYNTWENTAFLMMARPVQKISVLIYFWWELVNHGGWPPNYVYEYREQRADDKFFFRFENGGTIFPRSARELRDDPGTRDFIGPDTANAILAEYPLRPDETSAVRLGLGGPRFGPPGAIVPGSTPFTFVRSMTGTNTHIEERSRTVQTTIRAGFSLTLFGIPILSFSAGKRMHTVHTSVQEETNSEVVSITGNMSSDLNHVNYIIEDRVWNTILISDEGQLMGAFNAVTGTVSDVDGAPIGGAVVTMPVGGITYEAFTDQDGNYTFRLGSNVQPGEYEVTCAGVTRTVTVAANETAALDYRRVSSGLARERPR